MIYLDTSVALAQLLAEDRSVVARKWRDSNSKRASGGFFRWGIPKSAET